MTVIRRGKPSLYHTTTHTNWVPFPLRLFSTGLTHPPPYPFYLLSTVRNCSFASFLFYTLLLISSPGAVIPLCLPPPPFVRTCQLCSASKNCSCAPPAYQCLCRASSAADSFPPIPTPVIPHSSCNAIEQSNPSLVLSGLMI